MEKQDYQFKSHYILIFSLLYFVQGISQSVFTVILPIYLLELQGTISASTIAYLGSIIMIPFIIKIIFGVLTDKYGIKKLGRRKPWILTALIMAGIVWIILPFILNANPSEAVGIFTLAGLITMFGMAMSDTAIDGFIIDITPKEKLGRTQGSTWGFRSLGIVMGGPVILIIMIFLPLDAIFITFGILIIVFAFLILLIKDIEKPREINLLSNLKIIVSKSKNWKLFTFSFFIAIVDGVIFSIISLFILISAGLVSSEGANIGMLETDLNLYEPQAYISSIVGIGILIGAFLGGYITDLKSRKFAYFFSLIVITGSLILLSIPVPATFLLIFAFLAGSGSGLAHSAFGSISSGYSKEYPELRGSYFALSASFVNFGTMLGLSLTGTMLNFMSTVTSNFYVIYAVVFLFMALISNIGIIPFLTLDPKIYEVKKENDVIIKTDD